MPAVGLEAVVGLGHQIVAAAAAHSQTLVMRMALSASAHRPQKVHLARSSRTTRRVPGVLMTDGSRRAGGGGRTRILPLCQSISGRPRAEPGDFHGRFRVTRGYDRRCADFCGEFQT